MGNLFTQFFVAILVFQPCVSDFTPPEFQDRAIQTLKPCTLLNQRDGQWREYRVVVFVDQSFLDLFVNWLAHFSIVCDGDTSMLDVISMDAETSTKLLAMAIKPSTLSFNLSDFIEDNSRSSRFSTVWRMRMSILATYMRRGMDVILSDTDALWFQDPLRIISQYRLEKWWCNFHTRLYWCACFSLSATFIATQLTSSLHEVHIRETFGRNGVLAFAWDSCMSVQGLLGLSLRTVSHRSCRYWQLQNQLLMIKRLRTRCCWGGASVGTVPCTISVSLPTGSRTHQEE